MTTVPPPLPGLQNVLSAHDSTPFISYLSQHAHIHYYATKPPSHNAPVSNHAFAADATHAFVCGSHVTIVSPPHKHTLPHRLHFAARHLAIVTTPTTIITAVAGFDGVLVFEVTRPFLSLTAHYTLPGSDGYPVVCVALRPGLFAAAAMDARVAVWRNPTAGASVLETPGLAHADRTTDMTFVAERLLVAFWSGRLVLFDVDKCTACWTLHVAERPQPEFGQRPGTFVVERDGLVAFLTGDGLLVFVRTSDAAFVQQRIGAYAKGLCAARGALYAVVDGRLVRREWITHETFTATCKTESSVTRT